MNDNIPIILAVEDDLSEAVVRNILNRCSKEYCVCLCLPKKGNGYIKKKIGSLNKTAKGTPCFVLTDLDNDKCPHQKIISWLKHEKNNNLIFRIAVHSIESWVIADRKGFSKFIGIPIEKITQHPDLESNPKKELLTLVSKSKRKEIKDAILPRKGSSARVGPDYNGTLVKYVNEYWKIREAAELSPSLKSTVAAIEKFKPIYQHNT